MLQVIRQEKNYESMTGADQRTADLIWEGLDGLGDDPSDYVVRDHLYPYMITFIKSRYERFKIRD